MHLKTESKKIFPTQIKKTVASFFKKDFLNEEATYELNKTVENKNKLNRDNLIYKTVNKKR